LAFIVFSRKKFHNTVFWVYYRALFFSDTFTLSISIFDYLQFFYGIFIETFSSFLCKSYFFLYSVMPATTSWILVVIGLDRMISIIRPKKFSFKNKTKFQLTVCFLILMWNATYYIPVIVYNEQVEFVFLINQTNTSDTFNSCLIQIDYQDILVRVMEILNSVIIPFILMFIFTSTTIVFLFHSRKKITHSNFNNNNSATQRNSTHLRDRKFAITSVAVNLFYLISVFPKTCMIVVFFNSNRQMNSEEVIINDFTYSLYFLNFASLFFINILVNHFFRKEFLNMLTRKISKVSVHASNQTHNVTSKKNNA
jgi:hypothetical protein